MAQVDVKIDDKELNKIYSALKKYPKVAKGATISALNRTVSSANAELQRNITKIYNIKKSDLSGGSKYQSEQSNNMIKVKKANASNLNAYIEARGSRLTLYRFVRGSGTPDNRKGKRVSIRVKKGKTFKLSRTTFIQYGKGGALQIFSRKSGNRRIERLLKTTSIAHMAAKEEVIKPTQEKAQETLKKRVEHEIEHRLSKIKQ